MNYQAPAIKTKTKGVAFFNTSRLFLLKITIYYDSVHCVECFSILLMVLPRLLGLVTMVPNVQLADHL
jgi:hypothetical protein